MIDLKKQIEEAVNNNFSDGKTSPIGSSRRSLYEYNKQSFINGIKSEVAKEYHTQNMYTEEEVLTIISKLGEFDSMSSSWLSAWFKKNKKK